MEVHIYIAIEERGGIADEVYAFTGFAELHAWERGMLAEFLDGEDGYSEDMPFDDQVDLYDEIAGDLEDGYRWFERVINVEFPPAEQSQA